MPEFDAIVVVRYYVVPIHDVIPRIEKIDAALVVVCYVIFGDVAIMASPLMDSILHVFCPHGPTL